MPFVQTATNQPGDQPGLFPLPPSSATAEALDPAWDRFVADVPGGCLHQTSIMGAFRAESDGCEVLRYQLRDVAGHILGGAQVLIKRLPLGVGMGLVPRGPLLAPEHLDRMSELLYGLGDACQRHGVGLVFVQPSAEAAASFDFPGHGLTPGHMSLLPTATAVVDLDKSPDELLAAMHPKTRANIRQGIKRGLTVRLGGAADLPVFHVLLTATAQRQSFTPASLEYFQTMWRHLGPHGCIHLLLAEAEGRPVAAQLLHSFGRTVNTKRVGWNGEGRAMNPNNVMHYQAMLYAHGLGMTRFDWDDISPEDARAVLEAKPGETPLLNSVTQYKLQFGSRVQLLPGPMALPPRSFKGRACKALLPLAQDSRTLRLAKRVFLGRGYY